MLKCDFHLHAKEDMTDAYKIRYSAKELIDYASKKKYNVLAITLHNQLFFNDDIQDYAMRKGILLIPGSEVRIGLQDFLILMKKPIFAVEDIRTYADLESFKKKYSKDVIIIAAHLFYPRYFSFEKNPKYDVVDAFEYSHFYLTWLNFNRKAVAIARKFGKPMIGNSDAHNLWQMDHTYSMIDSKKDVNSIFTQIMKGEVSVITEPYFFRTFFFMINPMNFVKEFLYNRRLAAKPKTNKKTKR